MVLPSPLRIEPIAGYSPAVGRLVCMLTYVRATTFAAVEGMTMEELDHLHDSHSNSIGALLAHIAAEERSYQVMTFEDRSLSSEENRQWSSAEKQSFSLWTNSDRAFEALNHDRSNRVIIER